MKYIKYLFVSIGSVTSALLGIVAGLGLMTFFHLFTYKIWLDGIILLLIVSVFTFGGFKLIRKGVKP